MYTKREILEKIENGDTEEANDIFLDFIEKLLTADKEEFYELREEWYCDDYESEEIDLTTLDVFDWNFFKEQQIDFVVDDEY